MYGLTLYYYKRKHQRIKDDNDLLIFARLSNDAFAYLHAGVSMTPGVTCQRWSAWRTSLSRTRPGTRCCTRSRGSARTCWSAPGVRSRPGRSRRRCCGAWRAASSSSGSPRDSCSAASGTCLVISGAASQGHAGSDTRGIFGEQGRHQDSFLIKQWSNFLR